jgi:DNA-directed RNA polymerase subunit beta'
MAFYQTEHIKTTDFDAIRLRLASPEVIRGWSYGEITKPETINYRTQRPEKGGLFAEEIFGPSKDWECYCGKYKKIRYKGIICDRCGVEVTYSLVRRERMGHIELAAPVAHIWFLRSIPSKIGAILDLSVQSLEKVIYFQSFIITEVNDELRTQTLEAVRQEYKAKRKQIDHEYERDVQRVQKNAAEKSWKTEQTHAELEKAEENKQRRVEELDADFESAERELKDLRPMKIISELDYHDLSLKFGHLFEAKIGSEAIDELLHRIDLDQTVAILQEELADASDAKRDRLMRRLKLLRALSVNKIEPHWMVLKALPVLPPDLRPMVALDGGRFATSDLNDLYRRVINRNNRLKRLMELNAPEVIVRNEKRMLQEAVDSLIDNGARHSKTVLAATGKKRQLKSLSDFLKGKQGRFRQNLLGKRIDYSGRSVIVVGPHLELHQCGLPKMMALELFKPFIIAQLIKRELVHNIRSANRYIEGDHPEVWDILEQIAADAVVLLNRAPTLHRLGIQGFQPKLIEGKAIQIHPLVCTAFNADFDGDQMAVHIPLTEEARWEARNLMLSTRNLLKPATGDPVVQPDKDIAWGCFYITSMQEPKDGKIKTFGSSDQAIYAYQSGRLDVREKIKTRVRPNEEIIETTVGRLILNRILPKEIGFRNEVIGKKQLATIMQTTILVRGFDRAAKFADEVKQLGFSLVTKSGFSYGLGDLPTIVKTEIIAEGETKAQEVEGQYKEGLLTKKERHSRIVSIWSEAKDRIQKQSVEALENRGSVYAMINSGARGSAGQLVQVVGMCGLKANPSGDIIELPIKSSYREGLDVLEYFISTHGTRKGLTDTALKTANAGYLTRRLVDVAQDIVVASEDCGDETGAILTQKECEEVGEPMLSRIFGRYLIKDIKDLETGKVLVKKGALITEEEMKVLKTAKIDNVAVRSVLSCKMRRGLCQKCYGYDLAFNKLVKLGTAVGIIAAQSIGEPGTQLTMRTFHMGGTAGFDITMGLPRVEELFEARQPKHKAIVAEVAGPVKIIEAEKRILQSTTGEKIVDTSGTKMVHIPYLAKQEKKFSFLKKDTVKVEDGQKVKEGQMLVLHANGEESVASHKGTVKVSKGEIVLSFEAQAMAEHEVPVGYRLIVKDGQEVAAGDALTEGQMDLHDLFRLKGQESVMRYILKEVLAVYLSQGQKLSGKHIELMIRQMFSRVYVREAGDSEFLPGQVIAKTRADAELARLAALPDATMPVIEQLFLGITKVALSTESFLSAASFMETARVLIDASLTGRLDRLEGLKENVIIGRLSPTGTGFEGNEFQQLADEYEAAKKG